MRILFLSPRQCWPTVTGAKLRDYHLARALANYADVTYVYFAQPGDAGRVELPFCKRVVPVPQPKRYTPVKILRGLLGQRPLPILNYLSPEMQAALDALLQEEPFDLIHLDSLHMGAYLPLFEQRSSAPVVFDWHNIESEAMRRYSQSSKSLPRKFYAAVTARRLEAFERYVLQRAAGHAVCSQREKDRLARIAPSARIAVIENGVDTGYFAQTSDSSPERNRLIFVGSMEYHPNVEAAMEFARTVWPVLHARFPQWQFTIVGSNPVEAVRALDGRNQIVVTGTVPDIRPYYRDALASVVPLRTGGGTRLKILEAMAAGVPVVSTPLGAEGLAVSPGENILITRQDGDWPLHLGALASDRPLWARLATAGRELARSRYDWSIIGEELHRSYRDWLREETA